MNYRTTVSKDSMYRRPPSSKACYGVTRQHNSDVLSTARKHTGEDEVMQNTPDKWYSLAIADKIDSAKQLSLKTNVKGYLRNKNY